ncbi:hypothetical protein MMC30_006266 [Trapelia coarctata]|nr:hypothetical protein [Trapelia coarctata]
MFGFSTGDDPTSGYVNYVDQGNAQAGGLINTNNGQVYIGVDYTNQATGRGRNSVRLESHKVYTRALVVLDLAHMPGGICGTWPAFWMVGPHWPSGGEIDIIEGVNDQSNNAMTLHTTASCSVTSDVSLFSGSLTTGNCDVNAQGQFANQGCGFSASTSASYGTGFNSNGGGVYAMEWTSTGISIWFWPRGTAPGDVSGSAPDPTGWGKPQSHFAGCDFDQHFSNNQIVFDTTFCGAWAGSAWGGSCAAAHGGSCNAFVQNNPGAFKDAYWLVNSLKVYQENGSPASAPAVKMAAASSAAPVVSTPAAVAPAPSSTAVEIVAAVASPPPPPPPSQPSTAPAAAPAPPSPTTDSPVMQTVTVTAPPAVVTVPALDSTSFGTGSPGIPRQSSPFAVKRSVRARHIHQHMRPGKGHA